MRGAQALVALPITLACFALVLQVCHDHGGPATILLNVCFWLIAIWTLQSPLARCVLNYAGLRRVLGVAYESCLISL